MKIKQLMDKTSGYGSQKRKKPLYIFEINSHDCGSDSVFNDDEGGNVVYEIGISPLTAQEEIAVLNSAKGSGAIHELVKASIKTFNVKDETENRETLTGGELEWLWENLQTSGRALLVQGFTQALGGSGNTERFLSTMRKE